ncbi:hypothetical protein F511_41757 [Dorcoceras hygrometricum]|uniref:Uncharacterized protein n=1 Tax=Dorcoceras hygrometricum TaxID=472368 RepID=A0A2Z7C9X4_9LAMI|nr:hypothetical protein F511_41757 [Dorcoceras hygrometricum]
MKSAGRNVEEDDESVDTSKSNADQLECHESAASSKESGTSDDNVISDIIVISRSTSRIAKSADGLVLMTSAVTWNIEEDDESVDTSKSNADQLECQESAASSKESGTSDDNVISDVIVISRSTSRIAKSADGLVMMSLVTTSCSADEERPAGAKRISRCATRICYLEIEIEKRCRLHKLIRQRFALALKIQQMLFALITSSCKIPAGSYSTSSRKIISRSAKIQTQRKNSAEAQSSSRHESAAKQLTIYESWMSTAELKFKWRKRQEACKRKGHKYYSMSVLYRTLLNGKNFVSNGINLNRGYIFEKSAIEDVVDSADALCVDNQSQDTSRELQWIQSQAFHDQRLDNQLQTYRYNQLDIQTQAIFIQSRATGDPVEGYSALHIQSPKNSAEAQRVVDMNQQQSS